MRGQPVVVVVAGPNGAGKSTVAPPLLHDTLGAVPFVNADAIESELTSAAASGTSVAAGRIMLERMRTHAQRQESFAFETTLATRSFAPWLHRLKSAGYALHVIFLWLPSVETAVARVADRVARGGHAVSHPTIRRRYQRGLRNLFELYLPLASTWRVYDSSDVSLVLMAEGLADGTQRVYDEAKWRLAGQVGADREG